MVLNDRTIVNAYKLEQKTFQLNLRKSFSLSVIEHWNRIPKEVMEFPSLKTFKNLPGHIPMEPDLPGKLVYIISGGHFQQLLFCGHCMSSVVCLSAHRKVWTGDFYTVFVSEWMSNVIHVLETLQYFSHRQIQHKIQN